MTQEEVETLARDARRLADRMMEEGWDDHAFVRRMANVLIELRSERDAARAERRYVRSRTLRAAADTARSACLVQPDGGSPTEDERRVCEEAARRILASGKLDAPHDA
jgi:hypothetical protein